VCCDPIGQNVSASRSSKDQDVRTERKVTLALEDFAWETIDDEATGGGVTTEELIAFSVLYYLADVDSGRISRQISRSSYSRVLNDHTPGATNRRAGTRSEQSVSDRG
jgi:hypothetical protein